jgi:putative FmdB family regulatory protein
MPLYEYECAECHRRTEKIQKFSDPELTVCPHCGGKLARTITAPSFQFAGGGWYKDLYASAKPGAPAETKSDSGSAATTEGKSSGDSAAAPSTPAATATPAPASKP